MCREISRRRQLLMMMIEEEGDEEPSVNAKNVTPISFVLSSPSDLLTTITIHTYKHLLSNTLQRASRNAPSYSSY